MPGAGFKRGWALRLKQWEQLSNSLGSRDWKRVSLHPDYQDGIPKAPGVYVICGTPRIPDCRPFKSLFDVIYAGQARSLRRRFLEHCYTPKSELLEARASLRPELDFWFWEADQSDLCRLESMLIKTLGPTANAIAAPAIKARLGEPVPASQA